MNGPEAWEIGQRIVLELLAVMALGIWLAEYLVK